jgi:hypothetical protein
MSIIACTKQDMTDVKFVMYSYFKFKVTQLIFGLYTAVCAEYCRFLTHSCMYNNIPTA